MASTSDIQSLPVRTKNPMQWRTAFRALRALVKDNDDTTQVFKIVDALRGNSDIRNTERMKQSEIGRKILSERRSLIDVLSAREQLRGLHEGTLPRARR